MLRLRIVELIDLVESGVPNPETSIEKAFDWDHSRRMDLAKWILTAAVALFIPVVLSYLKGDIRSETPGWWILAALFGSVE